jgi:endonuclease-3
LDSPEKMKRISEKLEGYYGEPPSPEGDSDPFRTLIGCVLSQRTRESNAGRAAERLFEAASTPGEVLGLGDETIRDLVRCSGFYNQKADYISGICQALVRDHGGNVPRDRETLMSLPGVGPKTADIVLSYAYSEPSIAVDVHVSRVARRVGLAPEGADPEEVKERLEGATPMEDYRFIDNSFVRVGKEFCRKKNPKCLECPLNMICEHYRGEAV